MSTPLERFFNAAWTIFVDGGDWDGADLMDAIVASGLGEWCQATEDDLALMPDYDIEVGDQIVKPTSAGAKALRAVAMDLRPEDR